MRIGLFGDPGSSVESTVGGAVSADTAGFASYWLPQDVGIDAMTVLALAGLRTEKIELVTAVQPIQLRHPHALVSQALSTQVACGGRFTLGLGLSHQDVAETTWGASYDRPAHRMGEYLEVTRRLLAGEDVTFTGDTLTAVGGIDVETTGPPPVLLAALGPVMLRLAGEFATGTITWCTGPRTLAEYVVPTINEAAEAAGRPAPRIIAGLPVAITAEPDAARRATENEIGFFAEMPSYRAMLDREGVQGAGDIAIVGTESEVGDRLAALAASGVTDLAVVEIEPGNSAQRARTHEFLLGSNF